MGCGRVGSRLAHSLEERSHTVAIIDANAESFRRLGPGFVGETVTGIGFDQQVLEAAGIRRASGFAAVSSGDNSNIISARVARETFGIDNVVARIYDPRRAAVYQRLGIPTVATVRWTSDQVLRSLLPEGSEPEWRDPSGKLRMVELRCPEDWVGHKIRELDELGARVAFLSRLGEGAMAEPDLVIQDGDVLHVVMKESGADAVDAAIAAGPEETH
ncbi:MAG: potassium channel family protein [Nocardioidaceae bacterium]